MTEIGGNVVFSASGSLNTDGLTSGGAVSAWGIINAVAPILAFGIGDYVFYFDSSFTAPAGFGTNASDVLPDSVVFIGDNFGVLFSAGLVVPTGYLSESPLSGSLTFSRTDLATMDLIPGEYVWSWGSGSTADTFTLTIVPEPSSFLLISLTACLSLTRRRA
jgi:hypothetical protein